MSLSKHSKEEPKKAGSERNPENRSPLEDISKMVEEGCTMEEIDRCYPFEYKQLMDILETRRLLAIDMWNSYGFTTTNPK